MGTNNQPLRHPASRLSRRLEICLNDGGIIYGHDPKCDADKDIRTFEVFKDTDGRSSIRAKCTCDFIESIREDERAHILEEIMELPAWQEEGYAFTEADEFKVLNRNSVIEVIAGGERA